MNFLGISFHYRLGLLILVLGALAAWDGYRNRGKAARWREYGFLLLAGCAGAIFGVMNDLITSSISQEYFVLGKGIAPGDGFRLRVAALGLEAGFTAGAIAGGLLLIANSPKPGRPALSLGRLFGWFWKAAAAAAAAGALLGAAAHLFPPEEVLTGLREEERLGDAEARRFVIVWGIHIGLYLGFAAAIILGIARIRRARRARRAQVTTLILASALLLAAGCACWIPRAIARSPNHGKEIAAGPGAEMRVEVGPPPASLAMDVLEPAAAGSEAPAAPRGTILVLHGWRKEKSGMRRFAEPLARGGYRAVLVDLRGHGRSSGDWMTYGIIESRDLSQVLDALEVRGLLAAPVGAFGISYGAAVAIQFARADPRVQAVVAAAPFASLRTAAPHLVRLALPVTGWFLSEARIQELLDDSGRMGNFDPSRASPLEAIAADDTPVLLIHGGSDLSIPADHSRALHAAAPGHSELLILEGEGHNSLFRDPGGRVSAAAVGWFDRRLAGSQDLHE